MSNLKEIVIDAGHFEYYNMGVSKKYYESVAMLKLSRLMRDKLNATGKVHASLTRDNETDIGLYQRGKIASDRGAFIFISEHTNAGVSSAKGVECFYSIDIPTDKIWADKLSLKVAQVMETTNRGSKIKESTVTKGEDYLGVIDSAQDNGVSHVFLIESGFHSNSTDEAKLRSDEYLNKIAITQCEVLCELCGVSYSETTKPTNPSPTPIVKPIPKPQPIQPKLNPRVKALQQLCNSLGIKDQNGNELICDSVSGSKTEYCVSKLPLCGIKYTQRQATKILQGFIGAKVDGVFGNESVRLLKVWQSAHKLSSDGICGKQTWLSFLK